MAVAYNENIEVSVLAVVMKNKENYQIIQDIVQQSYFWWRPFSYVWKCFENLENEQLGIDQISIENEMDRNGWMEGFAILSSGLSGKEALRYITNFEVVSENAETYAYELVEAYSSRKLNDLFEKQKEEIQKGKRSRDILSALDIETGKIATLIGAKSNSIVPINIASDEALASTIDAMEGRGSIIPTGLNFIDYFTKGLAKQRVIMIAGGTGDGKTAESTSIINQVSVLNKQQKTMGWISIEMDRKECVNRLISNNTGIPALRLDTGELKDFELDIYKKWKKKIDSSPVYIDDSSEITYPILKTKIRKMAELGCVSVVIDQLELITVPPQMLSLPDFVKFNWGSYQIKSYARQFDINIILLHQISRELNKGQNRGKDVKPVVQDVNSGGDKGVDMVFIIRHNSDRTESYQNCVKNRQGISGRRTVMKFIGNRMRFEDAEKEQLLPEGFEEVPQDVIDDYVNNFEEELEIAP